MIFLTGIYDMINPSLCNSKLYFTFLNNQIVYDIIEKIWLVPTIYSPPPPPPYTSNEICKLR